jgi:RHS repeat-associated protein
MKNVSRFAATTIMFLCGVIPTLAQNTGTGVQSYGSYTQGSVDTVNNQNLNVRAEFQVGSVKGRGVNFSYSVSNDSQIWTPVTSGTTTSWTPPPAVIGDPPNGFWGWRTLRPNGNITWTKTFIGTCKDSFTGQTDYLYHYYNYVYTDPDGLKHTFSAVNFQMTSTPICTIPSGTLAGYADDGSRLYLTLGGQVNLMPKVIDTSGIQRTGLGWGTNTTNAAHYGTVSDTNGNYISTAPAVALCTNAYTQENWTDSAGRFIMSAYNCPTYNNYVVLGTGGGYIVSLQTINIKTNFACSGVVEYTGTATLPSSIALPNNQSYTFTYEPTPGNSGYYTGRLLKVTLPNGGYIEYDYTGANDGINCSDGTTLNLTRKVNDGTNTRVWTFSRSGSSTTVTAPQLSYDSAANSTVYGFDGSGRETSRKIYQGSSSGTLLRTINTTWNTQNAPASAVTILEDNSTQSEVDTLYDSNRNITSVAEYDWGSGSHGALLRTTTYGYVTSSSYTSTTANILNLVSDVTIQDGSGTAKSRKHINYDGAGLGSCPTGISQHDDTNYGCSFVYRGNPTSTISYLDPVTPGNGITKNFTYDVFGNLMTAQLNCCQQKQWVYSSTTGYSLPDSVTNGSSGTQLTTSYTYGLDQVSKATDPNGQSTSITYDVMRRRLVVTRPDNTQLTTAYNDTSHQRTVTSPINGSSSSVQVAAFDTLGRTTTVTLQDKNNNIYSIVQNQYDELGRLSGTSNPYTGSSPSYWTTTQFDALGRPTKRNLPDGKQATYSYATNTVTVTDPAGKKKKIQTDGAGRLLTVYEPDVNNGNSLTQQTTYTFDPMDNLIGVTQGSQSRTYVYDALSRLMRTTTPESGTVCYGTVVSGVCQANGYDNYSNLLYRTDARGVVTSYGYDTLNRLTGISYNVSGAPGVPSTASVTYSYGSTPASYNNGLLIGLTDGSGSENYTYDNLERPTQLQKIIGSTTYTTTFGFNLANELTSITYPSGRIVQPSYDAVARLSQVASGATNYQSAIAYNTAQQVTGFSYGNGINAAFGYSADRLQLNCLDYSSTNRSGNCAHDGTTKFGLSYGYTQNGGNNGQITGITDSVDNGRSAAYTYDALYRLTNASTAGSTGFPAWGLSEAYDRYGNRTAQAIASGCSGIVCPTNSVSVSASTNRITTSGYGYDAAGNATNDGSNTLVYDAENRATSATNGSSAGAYIYDANRMRVKKCVPNCTSPTMSTVYIFMGNKVIAEYDNGAVPSAPSREYIYGTALLAKIEGGSTLYYHRDHLSNRVLTDTSGNSVSQSGHFPFGESWYGTGTSTKWTFTTYERDSESGNDYSLARHYVNRLARFSSPDSLSGSSGNPQSLNRYTYALNDPINLVDPTGRYCVYYANDFGNPNDVESIDAQSNPGECLANGGQWFDGPNETVTVTADALDVPTEGACSSDLCVRLTNLTAFQNALNFIKVFNLNDPLCQKDLTALGITDAQVNQGAASAQVQDGTGSQVPYSSLFANARSSDIRNGALAGAPGTVGDNLAKSGNYEASELGGSNIYIAASKTDFSGGMLLGEAAHEVVHNVSGLTDWGVQDALGLPRSDPLKKINSSNITIKLLEDCFGGN